MKVCFPVQSDEGVNSSVYGHFGSAPGFIVFDTDTNALTSIANNDRHHAHGACNPLRALDNHEVHAIVVGGIGAGALNKLNHAGIKVYKAGAATIRENVEMFASGALQEFSNLLTCGGHSGGGACSH